MTEKLKPCEYCGARLPLGVDKKTRQMRSYHFARCEKRPKPEPTAPDPANSYARSIAVALHASHYPEVAQWRPLDDTMGLLTQIDNMTCSLVRAEAAAQARHEIENQAATIAGPRSDNAALVGNIEELEKLADSWASLSQDQGKLEREVELLRAAVAKYKKQVDELLWMKYQ